MIWALTHPRLVICGLLAVVALSTLVLILADTPDA